MQTSIEGGSAFAYINVDLEPGETVVAESDAMSSMSSDLSMDAKFNGGFFSGLAKAYLGGESLFGRYVQNVLTPRPLCAKCTYSSDRRCKVYLFCFCACLA